jgi:hypothetical protein
VAALSASLFLLSVLCFVFGDDAVDVVGSNWASIRSALPQGVQRDDVLR